MEGTHPVFCSPMLLGEKMRDIVGKGRSGACAHFSSFRKYGRLPTVPIM